MRGIQSPLCNRKEKTPYLVLPEQILFGCPDSIPESTARRPTGRILTSGCLTGAFVASISLVLKGRSQFFRQLREY